TLLLSFVFALGQGTAAPDTSTPENALHAFIKAWNDKDTVGMSNLILDMHPTDMFSTIVKQIQSNAVVLAASDFQTITQGDDAVVIYQLQVSQTATSPAAPRNRTGEDMVQFKHTADGWRIVPFKGDGGLTSVGVIGIGFITQLMSDPVLSRELTGSNVRATC